MNINIRSIVLIAIALVIAGITAFLARSLVATPETEQTIIAQAKEANIQILVSNKEINTGSFLKSGDLVWQSWPDENVNENYTQKTSESQADSQIEAFLGSVARAPISAGEPILNGRVVKPGNRGFMAAVLTPGYRAVSISINSRTGLSGFIFPGDNVDILLTHVVEEKSDDRGSDTVNIKVTETILTDIRVLAIDSQMSNEENIPAIGKIATFEVSPKQAEKIALISSMGDVSLALRSLGVDGDSDVNANKNNVTLDSEVSKIVAGQGGSSTFGSNKSVKVVRANTVENLTFADSNKNNR